MSPGGTYVGSINNFSELDIDFPEREFFKNADYRAGFINKVRKLRRNYRIYMIGGVCTVIAIVTVIFISTQ